MLDPEQLDGGMGNGGQVVRIGDTVRRPAGAHGNATSLLSDGLTGNGFLAPQPVGTDGDGRALFRWIDGEVPTPPYPRWPLQSENRIDGRVLEPGKLIERQEQLAAVDQHPEAVL